MDALLKIFWFLGWGAVAIFCSFLVGLLLGVVLSWLFRKPIPVKYRMLVDKIDSLEVELDRIDDAVGRLWVSKLPTDSRKPSTQAINTIALDAPSSEPVSPLITRIINAKIRLVSLRGDIDSVLPWLAEKPGGAGSAKNPPPKTRDETTVLIDVGLTDRERAPKVADLQTGGVLVGEGIEDRAGDDWSGGQETGRQVFGKDVAAEIIAVYNRASNDPEARERLREEYQPIRIGTVNAVERRQNPTIKAEFKETTDGDFFAFQIPGKNEHLVVPRLGVTIETVSYSAGALGEVFDKTRDHDPKLFYSRYSVKTPAYFARDGEHWVLRKSGELILGPGD